MTQAAHSTIFSSSATFSPSYIVHQKLNKSNKEWGIRWVVSVSRCRVWCVWQSLNSFSRSSMKTRRIWGTENGFKSSSNATAHIVRSTFIFETPFSPSLFLSLTWRRRDGMKKGLFRIQEADIKRRFAYFFVCYQLFHLISFVPSWRFAHSVWRALLKMELNSCGGGAMVNFSQWISSAPCSRSWVLNASLKYVKFSEDFCQSTQISRKHVGSVSSQSDVLEASKQQQKRRRRRHRKTWNWQ